MNTKALCSTEKKWVKIEKYALKTEKLRELSNGVRVAWQKQTNPVHPLHRPTGSAKMLIE